MMMSANDIRIVKEIKSKIAASNLKMDKLNKEIEDLLGIEETPSFYTSHGHFKLVKEKTPGTNTETWKLVQVSKRTIDKIKVKPRNIIIEPKINKPKGGS